jgi:hypothetical protein
MVGNRPDWEEGMTLRSSKTRHPVRGALARSPLAAALVLMLSACVTTVGSLPRTTFGAAQEGRLAAFVLFRRDVIAYSNLEEAFRGRVPSARIVSTADCPQIALRRARVPGPWSSPLVYVDGTRASGTCVLRDLSPRDVERVEIYPQGVTTRPGYAVHSNGLILIFMKG